jgi:hypothetical protein
MRIQKRYMSIDVYNPYFVDGSSKPWVWLDFLKTLELLEILKL